MKAREKRSRISYVFLWLQYTIRYLIDFGLTPVLVVLGSGCGIYVGSHYHADEASLAAMADSYSPVSWADRNRAGVTPAST